MFPEKHVRVFPETRTRICENTYVFWETDNEVLNAFWKKCTITMWKISTVSLRDILHRPRK